MTDETNRDAEQEEEDRNETAYEPPRVRKLGSLREITRGPDGGTIDSLFGGNGGFQNIS